MCFASDSSPQVPAISRAAVWPYDLVLESRDGNGFAALRKQEDSAAATDHASARVLDLLERHGR